MCYVGVLKSFVVFFFFKQKTAYEMRISDWSSDVCSSDLPGTPFMAETMRKDAHTAGQSMAQAMDMPHGAADSAHRPPAPSLSQPRSDERRVGKEGVRTCRSRWSPQHSKKNQ